ncbi:hypothetical protein [Thalassolituus sp.]|jgi:uncharacterized repeat protein (TIGR01451 family)|uniref:hypothetical protein n=1 Tax=Thalassolituus sp. TaxID=2030822 RepID=UPI00261FE88C|nr:hypothetical protein [uncultured Thalassolituus sp.]
MRLLTTLLLLFPFAALAGVSLESASYRIVAVKQDDGSIAEEWQTAETIAPGDKIGYRVTYVNTGNEAVSGVTINNPVPESTVYIMNSANGAGTEITYTVDGKTYGRIQDLNVTEDGEVRPARAKDIEGIRWVIPAPVAPESQGYVEFQVRVD